MPLLAHALGQELLGFWLLALALTAVFGCLNAGISATVVTSIGRSEDQGVVVTHAGLLALMCSLFVLAVGGGALLLVDFQELFNLSDDIPSSAVTNTVAILIVALALGFPGQLGRFVAIGRREGYKAQGIEMVSLLVGTLALVVAIFAGMGIVGLAAAFLLCPPVIVLFLSYAFLSSKGLLRTPENRIDVARIHSMASQALPMAAHQGLMASNQHGDVLIIGALLNPAEAALYGIGQRLCALANYVVTPINHALWPELTVLNAQADTIRMRRYFLMQIGTTITFALAFAGFMVLFGNWIITLWLGPSYHLSLALWAGLALNVVSFALTNTMEMMLRAKARFGFLLWCTSVAVPLGFLAKGAAAYAFGTVGVAWVGAISMLFLLGLPYSLAVFRSQKSESERGPLAR